MIEFLVEDDIEGSLVQVLEDAGFEITTEQEEDRYVVTREE